MHFIISALQENHFLHQALHLVSCIEFELQAEIIHSTVLNEHLKEICRLQENLFNGTSLSFPFTILKWIAIHFDIPQWMRHPLQKVEVLYIFEGN